MLLSSLIFVLGLNLAVTSLAISSANDLAALSTDITFSHCVLLCEPLSGLTSDDEHRIVPELAWSLGRDGAHAITSL